MDGSKISSGAQIPKDNQPGSVLRPSFPLLCDLSCCPDFACSGWPP